jgi:hypothetical protein
MGIQRPRQTTVKIRESGTNILSITFSTGLKIGVNTEDGTILATGFEGKPPFPTFRTPAKMPALKYARLRRGFQIRGTIVRDTQGHPGDGQYAITSFEWIPEPKASTTALSDDVYLQTIGGQGSLIQIILRDDMSKHYGYGRQVDIYRRRYSEDDSKLTYVESRDLGQVDKFIGHSVYLGIFQEQSRITDDDMLCIRFYPSGDQHDRYVVAESRRLFWPEKNSNKPDTGDGK